MTKPAHRILRVKALGFGSTAERDESSALAATAGRARAETPGTTEDDDPFPAGVPRPLFGRWSFAWIGVTLACLLAGATIGLLTASMPLERASRLQRFAAPQLPATLAFEAPPSSQGDLEQPVDADATAPSEPQASAPALRARALELLNRRHFDDALVAAHAAIEVDPDEALGYLYVGSALQDLGRWSDAMSTYRECVRRARTPAVAECRAMLRAR